MVLVGRGIVDEVMPAPLLVAGGTAAPPKVVGPPEAKALNPLVVGLADVTGFPKLDVDRPQGLELKLEERDCMLSPKLHLPSCSCSHF